MISCNGRVSFIVYLEIWTVRDSLQFENSRIEPVFHTNASRYQKQIIPFEAEIKTFMVQLTTGQQIIAYAETVTVIESSLSSILCVLRM